MILRGLKGIRKMLDHAALNPIVDVLAGQRSPRHLT